MLCEDSSKCYFKFHAVKALDDFTATFVPCVMARDGASLQNQTFDMSADLNAGDNYGFSNGNYFCSLHTNIKHPLETT